MEAKGGSVRVGELDVVALYELLLEPGDTLRISFARVSPDRAQALHAKPDTGSLVANGVSLRDAIFWSDTVPSEFIVSFMSAKPTKLKLWNEWRDHRGTEHAWLGNAGIVVVRNGVEFELRCSDGIGEPTFEDLIVKLTIVPKVVDFAAHRERRNQRVE